MMDFLEMMRLGFDVTEVADKHNASMSVQVTSDGLMRFEVYVGIENYDQWLAAKEMFREAE